jgi:gentisate 1,2-dioxygenase
VQDIGPIEPPPVRVTSADGPGQPAPGAEVEALYRSLEAELLVPLWTEIGDLMPESPQPQTMPHVWRWRALRHLAGRAGDLVPVGRGGERRAIALANPGLGGRPFATSTLWAAIQYLNPREDAPVHRHTQHAFRFVVEGEGVWTVVDGDPVAMRRGDFLPQAGWHWHGHHNVSDQPMAWIDGLDIPFQHSVGATFFEPGPDEVDTCQAPARSRSERLWAHPGLRPLTQIVPTTATPLLAYRWEHTDRALSEQLALEAEGVPATLEPGHAAIRYTNLTTGRDALPTVRTEFHRLAPGTETAIRRETGSSVFQAFDGAGTVTVADQIWAVEQGDLFVVPSWQPLQLATGPGLDLFRFSDAPIFERLHLDRHHEDGATS